VEFLDISWLKASFPWEQEGDDKDQEGDDANADNEEGDDTAQDGQEGENDEEEDLETENDSLEAAEIMEHDDENGDGKCSRVSWIASIWEPAPSGVLKASV
jgi:hypothetical protein